jgi:hypothetical protein
MPGFCVFDSKHPSFLNSGTFLLLLIHVGGKQSGSLVISY